MLESAVSAVYWFRASHVISFCNRVLIFRSLLLYFQIRPRIMDGTSSDWVGFRIHLWVSLYADARIERGAQIVFRSLIHPLFSRYFSQSGSTAANLRSQADQATKPHAL